MNLNKTAVFTAMLPDGDAIRVFSDGTTEGLPDGTVILNHFVARFNALNALVKKCVEAGVLTQEQADKLLISEGCAMTAEEREGLLRNMRWGWDERGDILLAAKREDVLREFPEALKTFDDYVMAGNIVAAVLNGEEP